MPESVIDFNPLVVYGQSTGPYASLIFLGRMGTEFSREYFEYFFADPSTFRKSGESEVVRIDFPQTCERRKRKMALIRKEIYKYSYNYYCYCYCYEIEEIFVFRLAGRSDERMYLET